MTDILTPIRRMLVNDAALKASVGKGPQPGTPGSPNWDAWIFTKNSFIVVENTSKSMIVLTNAGGWKTPNEHNRMQFPRVCVDVWSDPSRSSDRSVLIQDAEDKAAVVFQHVDRLMHVMKNSMPDPANPGQSMPLMWGTPEEVAAHTGLRINGSLCLDSGIDFKPIDGGSGGVMGRKYYGLNL